MWVLSCWPAAGSPRSYQCVQRIYMDLRTYIGNVNEVEVHCPIRHASRDTTKIWLNISKWSDFEKKMGKRAFLQCPAQFYGFRSEILTIQTFTHTLVYVAWCFSRTFWGLYWWVVNSHITVGACRRLVPFTPRLLPVSVHVPLAATVEKIANITR